MSVRQTIKGREGQKINYEEMMKEFAIEKKFHFPIDNEEIVIKGILTSCHVCMCKALGKILLLASCRTSNKN